MNLIMIRFGTVCDKITRINEYNTTVTTNVLSDGDDDDDDAVMMSMPKLFYVNFMYFEQFIQTVTVNWKLTNDKL